jgi:hypothetical protein
VGAQHYFALSPEDLSVLWEGAFDIKKDDRSITLGSITFIDPNIGGSGYLPKLAAELNEVAKVTIHHLDHDDWEVRAIDVKVLSESTISSFTEVACRNKHINRIDRRGSSRTISVIY